MSDNIKVTVYAQVVPKIVSRYNASLRKYEDKVDDATLVAVTKSRPTQPRKGAFLVKLRLVIPENAFLPFVPEALITIPENEFEPVVSVEAEDPREP